MPRLLRLPQAPQRLRVPITFYPLGDNMDMSGISHAQSPSLVQPLQRAHVEGAQCRVPSSTGSVRP